VSRGGRQSVFYTIMNIRLLQGIKGAQQARGATVIIDVFRAFTTTAYASNNGAESIFPVETIGQAFGLKRHHPDWILMGERGGIKIDGFDWGNSPYHIRNEDFTGKNIILTTSAGTQGIVNAKSSTHILLGSFVTAGALVQHLRNQGATEISLVAMGEAGISPAVEDTLLAEYLKSSLKGDRPDFAAMEKQIRLAPSAQKFLSPEKPEFPEGDYHCALSLDTYDFCLTVVPTPEGLKTEKVYPFI